MDSHQIILKPVLTEKGLAKQESGSYSFWVQPKATKNQIKEAVRVLFGVRPVAVRTILVKGKRRKNRRRNFITQRPLRKKAIIQLKKDEKIELMLIGKKK